MLRKLLPLLVIGIWGITVVSLPERASATTPLTRAEIEKIRNLVQLKPKIGQQRPARSSDAMFPGDGVSTGRASLAELRFNDRSLARVGEQAVFQFLPRTRNFKLSNGTVLLLIPPKQGQTRIQTPNAAAAIRGSALFVRYDEQTDTTVVGALTTSGIKVSNKDASQSRVLEAGQMLVIVKDRIKGLYEFDLRNFYERSDLVRGLDLARKTGVPSSDPAIAQVQEETVTALAAQKPITGAGVIENPSFIKLTGSSPTSPSVTDNNINNNSPIDPLVDIGQALSNNDKKKDNSSGSTPITNPPVTNLPITNPPVTNLPITNPPVTNPPITNPPVTNPPITNPPVTNPPVTNPPVTNPPVTNPPVTNPPVTPPQSESPGDRPPVTNPPVTNPPVTPPQSESPGDRPPVTTPPVTNPPVTNPPVTNPPVTPPQSESPGDRPPVTTPPVTNPPVTNPPVTNPPVTPPQSESPGDRPPVTTPPVTNPPVTNPPVTPPQSESPGDRPPVTTPPVTNPPVTNPPVTPPPVTNPPVTNPPVTNPPVTNPPVTTPPVTPPVKPST